MIIAVTGATGFIGNHVINTLLERNDDNSIVAVSRSIDKARESSWFDRVEYVACDINKEIDCYERLMKPDCLIHLAWDGLPNYKGLFHFEKNLYGDYRFLKSMIQGGLKRIFVSGTCFEYGLQEGCLSEDTPANPCTSYGIAKDSLRRMLEMLVEEYSDASLCWGRLFYTYGQGQSKSSFVPLLRSAIENGDAVFNMSGGEQVRDFMPVEEVARLIVGLTMNNAANGVYNVCSGEPVTLLKLAEGIISESNSGIELNRGYYPYPDYEPMAFWGDTNKRMRLND